MLKSIKEAESITRWQSCRRSRDQMITTYRAERDRVIQEIDRGGFAPPGDGEVSVRAQSEREVRRGFASSGKSRSEKRRTRDLGPRASGLGKRRTARPSQTTTARAREAKS